MKKVIGLLVMLAAASAYADDPKYVTTEQAQKITAQDYNPGALRHIVIFKFRPEVTAAQIQDINTRFLALKSECLRDGKKYIRSIDSGLANSPEGADQGKQIGFIVTLNSEGDRNYYVGQPQINPTDTDYFDPAHVKFKNIVGPLLATPVVPDGVFVFDYKVTGIAK